MEKGHLHFLVKNGGGLRMGAPEESTLYTAYNKQWPKDPH